MDFLHERAGGIVSLPLVSRLIEDPSYLVEQMHKARKHLSIDYTGIGALPRFSPGGARQGPGG